MGWEGRRLTRYPSRTGQAGYLALTMVTAVMLAWLANVAGGVAPKIMAEFGMSFRFYVAVAIVSIGIGATGALAAGLADRFGRITIIVGGLVLASLLVLIALPSAGSKWAYLLVTAGTGIVEGAAGVALPAMVRDFSPQVNRGTAMALWALGPVLGSLIVTAVAKLTLDAHPDWRFQFRLAGSVGLVVAVLAAAGLRELSPGLRSQILVRGQDRELAQLRSERAAVHRPGWRSVLGVDVLASALAISVYLIFYYVLVGFFVTYLETNFGYSGSRANGLANTYWAASAVSMVAAGTLSDRLAVRKPVMVVGALIGAAGSTLMAWTSTSHQVGHGTLVAVVVLAAVGNALVFAPWLAAFTETVERRNPAATASGLAVWGAVNKIVVTLVLLAFSLVVIAPSVLVDKGSRVQAIATEHPAAVQALAAGEPLPAGDPLPAAEVEYLHAHLADVARAGENGPHQWQRWWWVCAGGQLLFLAFVPLMAGRWRPRTAREDLASHDRRSELALQELRAAGAA